MLRRSLVTTVALAAAAAVLAAPAAAGQYVAPPRSGALFLFDGHGWGHGVGMSQWGAEGYAQHAYTFQQILGAYYPGTSLGQTPVTTIRVLLAERKTLTISSDQPITVTGSDGVQHTLPAGATQLTPALTLAVDGAAAQPLEPPLTFVPSDGSYLTLGREYRGEIVVDVAGVRLEAINELPLEQYLAGVVPAEMPSTWLPAALEAQAVASRSYAVATRRVAAPFDVYADTRSQLYLGVSAERPAATAAVAATAGQVLFYGDQVATTYFSSSSGGRTQAAADAWGGQSVPYLPSVPDPYDGISPYHDWGPVPVPADALAHALDVAGRVFDARTALNPSKRVAQLDVSSLVRGRATTTPVPGSLAQGRLDLRSTWFRVAVLSLQPPQPNRAVPVGTKVKLTGVLRGVHGAVLQQHSMHVPWSDLEKPRPAGRTRAFTVVVRPRITTLYRLAVPAAAGGVVRIRVTPRVRLASATTSGVEGRERPVLPGARVLVQQQPAAGSGRWRTVARGTVATNGSFTVAGTLSPGPTRVVVAPGHGYWPGASTAATVP
jgi:stage II sporulation protein D